MRAKSSWSSSKRPPATSLSGPPVPLETPEVTPRWLPVVLLAITVALLLAVFSNAVGDLDGWWHLKTGQYIVQQRHLPVPDPFAYTTYMGGPAYPQEPIVRDFNLTHEWLSQVTFYVSYAAGGFGGLVALRMLVLTLFCASVGWLTYRRCQNIYWALAGALAAANVIAIFAVERPHIFTYLLLSVTLLTLERGRPLWVLPPLFLLWANFHGGFIIGWVALGGYSGEALWRKWRGGQAGDWRKLLWVTAACVLLSGVNPNGYRTIQVLLSYRTSTIQSGIVEWMPINHTELSTVNVLIYGGALCLLWARTRARLVDWLFFLSFAAAAFSAWRNVFLMALIGPVTLAAYFPWKRAIAWVGQCLVVVLSVGCFLEIHGMAEWQKAAALAVAAGGVYLLAKRRQWMGGAGVAAILACATWSQCVSGHCFRFLAAEDYYPKGAADFMVAHHITGRMLNNYHFGGYLIWKLWPQERVAMDGRVLNEAAFSDMIHIQTMDASGGKDPLKLLDEYGIDVVLMNGVDVVFGKPYPVIPVLLTLPNTPWKVVYTDQIAMILMRNPPPDIKRLPPVSAITATENQCSFHLQFYPKDTYCAQGLMNFFRANGDQMRTERWLRMWVEHKHEPDPEAERAYQLLPPK